MSTQHDNDGNGSQLRDVTFHYFQHGVELFERGVFDSLSSAGFWQVANRQNIVGLTYGAFVEKLRRPRTSPGSLCVANSRFDRAYT